MPRRTPGSSDRHLSHIALPVPSLLSPCRLLLPPHLQPCQPLPSSALSSLPLASSPVLRPRIFTTAQRALFYATAILRAHVCALTKQQTAPRACTRQPRTAREQTRALASPQVWTADADGVVAAQDERGRTTYRRRRVATFARAAVANTRSTITAVACRQFHAGTRALLLCGPPFPDTHARVLRFWLFVVCRCGWNAIPPLTTRRMTKDVLARQTLL